jgi:hypothetical protein
VLIERIGTSTEIALGGSTYRAIRMLPPSPRALTAFRVGGKRRQPCPLALHGYLQPVVIPTVAKRWTRVRGAREIVGQTLV